MDAVFAAVVGTAKPVGRTWLGFVNVLRAGGVIIASTAAAKWCFHAVGVNSSAGVIVGVVVGCGLVGAYLWL